MQMLGVGRILKEILLHGKKTVIHPIPDSNEKWDPDLELCIRNGWIYTEHTDPAIATHDYVFASPLHARFVQWCYFGSRKGEKSTMDLAP